MKIGDRVKLNDPMSDTLYGQIMDKIEPSCKCKGKGEWLIKFNDVVGYRKINRNDSRLELVEPMEIKKTDFTHKM